MYDQEIFKSKSSFFQIIQYTSFKKKKYNSCLSWHHFHNFKQSKISGIQFIEFNHINHSLEIHAFEVNYKY